MAERSHDTIDPITPGNAAAAFPEFKVFDLLPMLQVSKLTELIRAVNHFPG